MKHILIFISIILFFISCDTSKKPKNDVTSSNYTSSRAEETIHLEKKEIVETNLVILGGGKTKTDAEKIKEQYLTDKVFNSSIIGAPVILLSDTISGLNPSFFITTIGCVADDDEVKLIVKKANTYWKGVYYKKVKLNENQYKEIASKIIIKSNSCAYENLSEAYNFEIEQAENPNGIASDYPYTIKITPISKTDNEKQNSIHVNAFSKSFTFEACDDYVSSYSTNINAEFFDFGDAGDFVVADFNFDSQDDFAVKISEGGSAGGPRYVFYLQKNKEFVKDEFLCSVGIFPNEIDVSQKQLKIDYPNDRCSMFKKIYQFDDDVDNWYLLSEEEVMLCE